MRLHDNAIAATVNAVNDFADDGYTEIDPVAWRQLKLLSRSYLREWANRFRDPLKRLETHIQDLREQLPFIDEYIAAINEHRLAVDEEHERLGVQVATLEARIASALAQGEEPLASDYGVELLKAKQSRTHVRAQKSAIDENYDNALALKQRFLADIEDKSHRAVHLLRDRHAADWHRRAEAALAGVQNERRHGRHALVADLEQAASASRAHFNTALSGERDWRAAEHAQRAEQAQHQVEAIRLNAKHRDSSAP